MCISECCKIKKEVDAYIALHLILMENTRVFWEKYVKENEFLCYYTTYGVKCKKKNKKRIETLALLIKKNANERKAKIIYIYKFPFFFSCHGKWKKK